MDEVVKTVVGDMNTFGVCVLDNFLGREKGLAVLEEVKYLHHLGLFQDGELVSNRYNTDSRIIRSDRITWIDGKESSYTNINSLMRTIDSIVFRAHKVKQDGNDINKMSLYQIKERSPAMVACYSGQGSRYVKHVDNPNRDGRCITAIYYLNQNWDVRTDGGLLRIFPSGMENNVADVEPVFDRLLFFWSDRRNPHEVLPAYKTRYAITLWYFDATEREEACRRFRTKDE